MQGHINIEVIEYAGVIIIQSHSLTADHCCIWEMPEKLTIAADDAELGQAVILAANRCRGIVNEPPSMAEDNARALGFKSYNEMQKKSVHISISRRKNEPELHMRPVRKANNSGTSYVFTETELTAPIEDAKAIGRATREALRLSAEWKTLPPLKL